MTLAGPHVRVHESRVQPVAVGLALGVKHDVTERLRGEHAVLPAHDHLGFKQEPAQYIHDHLGGVADLLLQQGAGEYGVDKVAVKLRTAFSTGFIAIQKTQQFLPLLLGHGSIGVQLAFIQGNTLFLKFLVPITRRMKLTYGEEADLSFTKKQIAALVLLVVVGIGSAVGYLTYRYNDTSRSADYTDKQRVEANKSAAALVLDKTDDWDDETVICIVDSAFRPMFDKTTDYTVSVYILDQDAFARVVDET